MVSYETISDLALKQVGATSENDLTVTQGTIFRLFREFGMKIAIVADKQKEEIQSVDPSASFYRVLQLVKDPHQFINAIKEFRTLTGAGLREAKEIVEFIRDRRF